MVQLTTIESELRYIRSRIPELDSDDDTLKEFFLAVWRAVQASYPALWAKDEKFMKKVNLNASDQPLGDPAARQFGREEFHQVRSEPDRPESPGSEESLA